MPASGFLRSSRWAPRGNPFRPCPPHGAAAASQAGERAGTHFLRSIERAGNFAAAAPGRIGAPIAGRFFTSINPRNLRLL